MARVNLQERLHPPALGDAMIDGEDRILVEQRQRQRRIEEAHMVERDDGVRSRLREVLRAPDLKPVEGSEQDGEKVAEGAGRHGAADCERRGEAGAADDEEQASAVPRPAFCSMATASPPATMKAALRTLTAATTRARRSAPAQACTAANDGTMNRPPAMARPARSIAMRKPRPEDRTAPMPAGVAAGCAPSVAQPRSSAKTPEKKRADNGWQEDDAPVREP